MYFSIKQRPGLFLIKNMSDDIKTKSSSKRAKQ